MVDTEGRKWEATEKKEYGRRRRRGKEMGGKREEGRKWETTEKGEIRDDNGGKKIGDENDGRRKWGTTKKREENGRQRMQKIVHDKEEGR